MKILNKIDSCGFPFKWVDIDFYPSSQSSRCEIYLKEEGYDSVDGLIYLFQVLFGSDKQDIFVYNNSWWDFCLETWDVNKDTHDYKIEGKSENVVKYLKMLEDSQIEYSFTRCCGCNDWEEFLKITINCVVKHYAPYSPLFFNVKNNYFFYFHHTESIGFYYLNRTTSVDKIINIARQEFSFVQRL